MILGLLCCWLTGFKAPVTPFKIFILRFSPGLFPTSLPRLCQTNYSESDRGMVGTSAQQLPCLTAVFCAGGTAAGQSVSDSTSARFLKLLLTDGKPELPISTSAS